MGGGRRPLHQGIRGEETAVQDVDDTVRVHVHTDHAGYVVVTDNIQTGFKASVDGRSALVADADYAGGAVYVEAGTHEVALHYEPPGRQTGARLTGLPHSLKGRFVAIAMDARSSRSVMIWKSSSAPRGSILT